MYIVRSLSVAAFGVFLALVATPASAQCDPWVCTNPYGTMAQAEPFCLFDRVVWINTKTHVYHFQGAQSYGHTGRGAYMCETEAKSVGGRAAPHRN